jgi:K+-sensing histidine kinase KdpD
VAEGNVAIAVPSDPERAHALLARGRRIARTLGVGWVAVRVQMPPAGDETTRRLRELVTTLGGRLLWAEADDVARAIIDLSCREGARILVIGPSGRWPLLRRLRRGTTDRILEARRPFDVVVAAPGTAR